METGNSIKSENTNAKLRLSPPWATFVNEVRVLFGEAPGVTIGYNIESSDPWLKLYVKGADKSEAISQLLGTERVFGNVTLKILVIPDNSETTGAELVRRAFAGNPVLKRVVEAKGGMFDNAYAVFRKEVVQFFNDELGDVNGNRSTLFEDIARDVIGLTAPGVFFCTDSE